MITKTKEFIQAFNEAFASTNLSFIEESVTEDVIWRMKGDQVIQGKSEMSATLRRMDEGGSFELLVEDIIVEGKTACANGTMKVMNADGKDGTTYAFCDIYHLSASDDNKIKEFTSFLIEEK